ncbi:hypothetical protein [Pseudogemmobacter blasticus]|uniref:Uncharacterized protein n=1 Tax=Fuscovulum blasticum DSM 2131 TaxID=1188250 RepID=A0A2T4JDJ1_FUSBL|nr:hypothetical protein [Fuscovulum blasticum]PTE15951.1 hypothetical protein C5F44_02620 [Fuscovulum blasticum DSM 2131]
MSNTAARLAQLEAAHLDLLTRVQVLERALRFEVGQREAMEAMVLKLTRLPGRIDRLEMIAARGRIKEAVK